MTAPDLRAESALLRLSKRAARWVSTLRVFAAVTGGTVAWEHAALLAENFFPTDAQVHMERALAKLGQDVVAIDERSIRFTWGTQEHTSPTELRRGLTEAPRVVASRTERMPAARQAAKAPMTPEERSARSRRAAEARWRAAGQLELPGTDGAVSHAHAHEHAHEHREHAELGSIHAKNTEKNAKTMLNAETSIPSIRASVEHREHAPQASRAHSPEIRIRISDPSASDLDPKDLTGSRATPAKTPEQTAAAAVLGAPSIPERRRDEFILPLPPPPIALPADLDLLPAQRGNLEMMGYSAARIDELVSDFKGRFAADPVRPLSAWVTFLWGYVKKCGAVDRRPQAERARLEAAAQRDAEAAAEKTLKLRQATPRLRCFTADQTEQIAAAMTAGDFELVKRLTAEFEAIQAAEDAQRAS